MTYQVRDKETDEALVESIHHGDPESHQVIALPRKNTRAVTTTRMALISEPQTMSCGEHVEKREPPDTVVGNAHWCSHCGKENGGSSKH